MTGREQSIHVAWPAGKFYWAKLDASSLPARNVLGLRVAPTPAQLGYLFENVLPLPVDELQTAFVKIRGGRSASNSTYLACGIERSRLRADLPANAVSLTPNNLDEVEVLRDLGDLDPGALNLLHGDFEPSTIRRLRRRSMLELVAAMLLVAALIAIGFHRRTQSMIADASMWRDAEAAIYDQVLGPASRQSAQPQQVQLTVELRRLRQTRRADATSGEVSIGGSDVVTSLADVLRLWPEANALTQSFSIAPGRINLRAAVPDAEQAQTLIDAIGPLPGWQLQQPAIRAGRDGLDLDLSFTPGTRPSAPELKTVSEGRP